MIFDFNPIIEYVGVTQQYSNAVLLAILPHVSEFARALHLPMPSPVIPAQVEQFQANRQRFNLEGQMTLNVGGGLRLTNGAAFSFNRGHIDSFEGPHSYFHLQNPDLIPQFYGSLRMNELEAVRLARRALDDLGYSLESLFAQLDPKVTPPERIGTNVVPHYLVEWLDPRGGWSATVEVNADRKMVEMLRLYNRNLDRPAPTISVEPERLLPGDPLREISQHRINRVYVYRLLPIVLRTVDEQTKRLGFDLPRPLTTNHVQRFWCEDHNGWPDAALELTNHWRFRFRNQQLTGLYAPDNFFDSGERGILVDDFVGRWNMNDKEIIALARATAAKLGYRKGFIHTEAQPTLHKPILLGKPIIPRCVVEWMYPNQIDSRQWLRIEIDADKRAVKSVYFDDSSFWGHPPPIDVPISSPPPPPTNLFEKTKAHNLPAGAGRPFRVPSNQNGAGFRP